MKAYFFLGFEIYKGALYQNWFVSDSPELVVYLENLRKLELENLVLVSFPFERMFRRTPDQTLKSYLADFDLILTSFWFKGNHIWQYKESSLEKDFIFLI